MPHNRFFAKEKITEKGACELCPEENSHLKVLRPHVGDSIELIDGCGTLAYGKVHSLEKAKTLVLVHDIYKEPPPLFQKSIALSLLRSSHLDFAIEKMTEVGIGAIFLFPSALSEKKELSENGKTRLLHIIKAACKQSGRLFLPKLLFFPTLLTLLENLKNTHIYFGDIDASEHVCAVDSDTLCCIGPESGFSEEEKAFLKESGGAPLTLSKNVLRAETAAMIAAYKLY